MKLEYGTYKEHKATAQRAKDNNLNSIWTGDLKRNPYLRENLSFIQEKGLAEVDLKVDYDGQSSSYVIKWKQ